MIKILHIINGVGSGGAESFVINIYKNIDTTKIQFDFLIKTKDLFYKSEIEKRGGKIYIMPSFPTHVFLNYIETKKFLETHKEYEAVHIHCNSLAYFIPLLALKKQNNVKIILHSHSTDTTSKLYKVIHYIARFILIKKIDYRLACSKKAGEWMFGKEEYQIIPNSIDIDKYMFSSLKRARIRNKYRIQENEIVIGHIGRFLPVKNHEFIIKVFREYLKINFNAKLMLVGSGVLFEKIKEETIDMSEKILFIGEVNNVDEYFSAFDTFIFPSFYEGLGIALIEAQASGLPCLVSDTIPKEAIVLSNVVQMSLEGSAQEWADCLNTLIRNGREKNISSLYEKGYDIKNLVELLSDIYKECQNENM